MLQSTPRARWLVAVLAIFALTLGACGSPDSTPAPPPTPTEVSLLEEEDIAPEDVDDADEMDEADEVDEADDEIVDETVDDAEVEATAEPEEESDATPEPTEEPAEEPGATPEPQEEDEDMSAPAETDEEDAFLASIMLSDGTVCLHAGRGATLAFDEKRVNYTCNEGVEGSALLGDMQVEMDLFTVEFGEFVTDEDDTLVIEDTEFIEMRLAEVTLADGTVCLNAGQGATLAFDEGRVNFTCDESDDGEIVLLGDMAVEMDVLTATRALLVEGDDGFELAETETVAVVEVVGSEP